MVKENVILHIAREEDWNKVKTENASYYHPERIKREGFIHCATREQILDAVEFIYKEKINLKILYIDPDKVKAEIVYEDLHSTGEKFPHIYGALNVDAVIRVVDFQPNTEGIFELPVV